MTQQTTGICHTRKKEKIGRSRTWNLSNVCPTSRWAQIFRNFGHNPESCASSWVWNRAVGKNVRRLEAAVRKQHPGQTRRWFAGKKLTLVIYSICSNRGVNINQSHAYSKLDRVRYGTCILSRSGIVSEAGTLCRWNIRVLVNDLGVVGKDRNSRGLLVA